MILIEEIRERFIAARKRRGANLQHVAFTTGVSFAAIGYFERGGVPRFYNLVALAKWAGIDLDSDRSGGGALAGISEALAKDESVPPEGKKALYQMMEGAYNSMKNEQSAKFA